jgi:hypothetical protein
MKHTDLLIPVLLVAFLNSACTDWTDPEKSSEAIADWQIWADAASLPSVELDGWVDTTYRFDNTNSAFEKGDGPIVCFDEAHFNYHTARGIYAPFSNLLVGDGYRVENFRSRFTLDALEGCQILVIANAQAPGNTIGFGSPESNWAYPHASALNRKEIDEIVVWIRGGGALLLIADHAPLPAAVSDLALLIGVHMLDGYAFASRSDLSGSGSLIFGAVQRDIWDAAMRNLSDLTGVDFERRYSSVLANPGSLASHPVNEGRQAEETIEWVVTFHGQAFLASDDWDPLMVMGANAVSLIPLSLNFKDAQWGDGPVISANNWLHGATRNLDAGRIAILGEGGMCTAQFDDLDGSIENPLEPYGFNAPQAPYNAQFCLNVVRWLSGILDK